MDVDHRQCLGVLLELGGELHDHLICIIRSIYRRYLSCSIGREERVLDLLRGEPERRGALAVDIDGQRRVFHEQVGVDINEPRQRAQLLQQCFG